MATAAPPLAAATAPASAVSPAVPATTTGVPAAWRSRLATSLQRRAGQFLRGHPEPGCSTIGLGPAPANASTRSASRWSGGVGRTEPAMPPGRGRGGAPKTASPAARTA
jgi:hypothetical protein